MKALLILDRPICCELCYLNRERLKGRYCVITDTYDKNYGNVKEDCPLKPLPQIKDEHVKIDNWELESIINAEHRGYNRCLEDLLGDEE